MRKVTYELIGAACGLGAGRPDTMRAPAFLRENGLIDRVRAVGATCIDGGDIESMPYPPSPGDPKLRNAPEILDFGNRLHAKLGECYSQGHFPIIVGGDHSLSIASVTAARQALTAKAGKDSELGLLWVDAHSDLNTSETTPSGNVHGMSVAAMLGLGDRRFAEFAGFAPKLKPENIVYVGLRDVDPGERETLKKFGMKAWTMKDIDLEGIGSVVRKAFEEVSKRTAGFVLSFDLDVVDPRYAPGVGTPVRGGLTLRESHLIMEFAAEAKNLMSVEVVELNPLVDPESVTGELAMCLVESAVGKSIL